MRLTLALIVETLLPHLPAPEKAIATIQTVADAELPAYDGPLYVIDNLLYESLPGFYVPAKLSGHTREGTTEPQIVPPGTPPSR